VLEFMWGGGTMLIGQNDSRWGNQKLPH